MDCTAVRDVAQRKHTRSNRVSIGRYLTWNHNGDRLTLRPRPNVNVSVDTSLTTNVIASKWVATIGNRYVFARLSDRRLEVAPRVDWTIRTNLTLQLYLQPFAATGSYDRFKELVPPGRDYRFAAGIPDGVGNPDFAVRTLRGNAVLRWEIRGSSTLFLVWNQERSDEGQEPSPVGREFRTISEVPPDDRFLIKIQSPIRSAAM